MVLLQLHQHRLELLVVLALVLLLDAHVLRQSLVQQRLQLVVVKIDVVVVVAASRRWRHNPHRRRRRPGRHGRSRRFAAGCITAIHRGRLQFHQTLFDPRFHTVRCDGRTTTTSPRIVATRQRQTAVRFQIGVAGLVVQRRRLAGRPIRTVPTVVFVVLVVVIVALHFVQHIKVAQFLVHFHALRMVGVLGFTVLLRRRRRRWLGVRQLSRWLRRCIQTRSLAGRRIGFLRLHTITIAIATLCR